jgi:hypothetical protein
LSAVEAAKSSKTKAPSSVQFVPTRTATDLVTGSTLVMARAKLPDDLTYDEFVGLVRALQTIGTAVRSRSSTSNLPRLSLNESGSTFARSYAPPFPLLKVQYGSDFLVILELVGSVAVPAGAVAGVFLAFAKAVKILVEAADRNEDRMLKKEAREQRKTERRLAMKVIEQQDEQANVEERSIAPSHPEWEFRIAALEQIVPAAERYRIEATLGYQPLAEVLNALAELADYRISVEVTDEEEAQ